MLIWGSKMATQDFVITDQASVWLFKPLTKAAQEFVRGGHVGLEEWLWRGQALVVDYRTAGALAEELQDEGFTLKTVH